jgi:membrane-bound transcription factor site-1 protease
VKYVAKQRVFSKALLGQAAEPTAAESTEAEFAAAALPAAEPTASPEDGSRGERWNKWAGRFPNMSDSPPPTATPRRKLLGAGSDITGTLGASAVWDRGFSGKGVRVAIFDTGVSEHHPHFKNIVERLNWTNEPTLEDGVGHGTFVAGVISGRSPQCRGFAPDADLYFFRVFTSQQVSYTSWFLDAFNYAIHSRVHVLNLSIGGPDFADRPFVEKVWEVSANNIMVVSAIGNDGPVFGTLNNPADMPDVLGVGGIDDQQGIASFSSRGMSTWELPHGYGRSKPDVVTYSKSIVGSAINGGCRALSGTSVAAPVVAGAVALLYSTAPPEQRHDGLRGALLNPATIKQALLRSARRLPGSPHLFEQGAGELQLAPAVRELELAMKAPEASLHPPALDLTECPYMWPYCKQPAYAHAMPVIVNVTILNPLGVTGRVSSPPRWVPAPGSALGKLLSVTCTHSAELWPWSGFLAVFIRVDGAAAAMEGLAEGQIELTVESDAPLMDTDADTLRAAAAAGLRPGRARSTELVLPVKVQVVPTPERAKRVLWDQFHSLAYPAPYIPRDNLAEQTVLLDLSGDHPHTNFREVFNSLRTWGYFLEVLGGDYTCFDAEQYGTLLVFDSEDEFLPEEVSKLHDDVTNKGLSVLVAADWYNAALVEKVRFFDENTLAWWDAATGGCNVPALNELLAPFGVSLGDRTFEGSVGHVQFLSGNSIRSFPKGGKLNVPKQPCELRDQSFKLLNDWQYPGCPSVLGFWQSPGGGEGEGEGGGRVVVFGDSAAFDTVTGSGDFQAAFLQQLLGYAAHGTEPADIETRTLDEPFLDQLKLPERVESAHAQLLRYSNSRRAGPAAGASCALSTKAGLAEGAGPGAVGEDWNDRVANVQDMPYAEFDPLIIPAP